MVATASTATRMTPEEFLALDEDYARGFELVDGQLLERPVSKASSRIGIKFGHKLEQFTEPLDLGNVYGSDLTFRCFVDDPGRLRRPDVAFISNVTEPPEDYEEEGFCTTVPDLVAEVVSPTDGAYDVERKIHEWLEAGVRVVLKLMPDTRTIQAYRSVVNVTHFQESDDLVIPDLLPGFRVAVKAVFRRSGEK